MSVFFNQRCYGADDFFIYALPEFIQESAKNGSVISGFGAIELDGSLQFIDLRYLVTLDSVASEAVKSLYLGPTSCGIEVPVFTAESFFYDMWEFDAELFQLGFAGVMSVFATGLGVGLIISQVRKLRRA